MGGASILASNHTTEEPQNGWASQERDGAKLERGERREKLPADRQSDGPPGIEHRIEDSRRASLARARAGKRKTAAVAALDQIGEKASEVTEIAASQSTMLIAIQLQAWISLARRASMVRN
ncbi:MULTISPECIES: hypothetical protein [unclassified Mesorhizobium]|uniref:hypothetical protein n=1 Tax=unclassified Mesorhizobium TaxID=325217 RepID=UPI000FCA579B|nr:MULTISPECIES: hypothetical protein [unclassified Mesorhizobium]RUV27042.1 hypothetical protein EOA91_01920 [Mesorhizobium sp. M1A.F.Ca.IN.022.04.1.1]RWG35575.1 MAG: hypothetical protein EOQ60_06680 [Mesorhizobium sp.]